MSSLNALITLGVIAFTAITLFETHDERTFNRGSPIATGLPRNFEEASLVFDRRVRDAFPSGNSEEEVIVRLQLQGFKVDRVVQTARLYRSVGLIAVCELQWVVRWETVAKQIERAQGQYGASCL